MKTYTVAAFNSPEEAEPIRQRLVEAGIAAELYEEARMDKTWFLPRASAGVRIEVPRKDFERALNLVHGWEQSRDRNVTRFGLPGVQSAVPASEPAVEEPRTGS
jgi:hypothetical protein